MHTCIVIAYSEILEFLHCSDGLHQHLILVHHQQIPHTHTITQLSLSILGKGRGNLYYNNIHMYSLRTHCFYDGIRYHLLNLLCQQPHLCPMAHPFLW